MSNNILIYGGTGGVGSALAKSLVAKGRKVHLVGRDRDRLKQAADALGAGFTVGDVLDNAIFARAAEEAADSGALGGLVYAVGTINLKPFAKLSLEDFERDFRLNAVGAALSLQAAAPALRASKTSPSALLFSTVAVAQGFTAHASIAMAKGAVEGLVRSLAAELAPDIRVNAIAPSLVKTPLAEGLTKSEQMATAIAGMHAIPRLGEPQDIASLGAFLLSEEAGWITGQVIGVDGGRSTLRVKG